MENSVLAGCDVCGGEHETEECPELVMEADTESATTLLSRARLTLPHFTDLAQDETGTLQVLAKEALPGKMKLGPLEARKTTQDIDIKGAFILKLLLRDGSSVTLDTSDENQCNWLCLVSAAEDNLEQNLMAVQMGVEIYYMTTRAIQVGEVFKVWYAPHYAKKLGQSPQPDGCTKILLGSQINSKMDVVLLVQDSEYSQQQVQEMLLENLHSKKEMLSDGSGSKKNSSREDLGASELTGSQTDNEATLVCNKCGFVARSEAMLNMHELVHSAYKANTSANEEDDLWKVPVATVNTINTLATPRQMKVIYDEKETANKHVCQKCNAIFNNVKDLAIHITEHIKQESNVGKRGRGRPRKHPRPVPNIGKLDKIIVPSETDKNISKTASKQSGQSDGNSESEDKASDLEILTDDEEFHEKRYVRISKRIPNIPQKTIIRTRRQAIHEKEIKKEHLSKQNGKIATGKEIMVDNLQESKYLSTKRFSGKKHYSLEKQDVASLKKNNVIQKTSTIMKRKQKLVFKDVTHLEIKKELEENRESNSDKGAQENENGKVIEENVASNVTNAEDKGGEHIVESTAEPHNIEEGTSMNTAENSPEEFRKQVDDIQNEYLNNYDQNECPSGETDQESMDKEDDNSSKRQQIMRNCKIIESSEGNNHYKCKICEKVFTKLEFFEVHSNVHLGTYKCSVCVLSFSTEEELDNHVCKFKEMHIKCEPGELTDIYSCQECGKSFDKKNYLLRHMLGHTDVFKCVDCHKRFARKESLINHPCTGKRAIKKEPGLEGEIPVFHYCEFCGQQFKNKKYLIRHMATHTGKFKCKVCGREFARKESLLMHKQKCDPGGNPDDAGFPCTLCNRVFTKELSLKNHMALHKEENKCPVCQKCFTSKFSLDRHKCDGHVIGEVNGELVFKCIECDKVFHKQLYLQRHMALHSEEFKCVICSQVFTRKEDLLKHTLECTAQIQSEATGEIKCTMCGEIFCDPPSYRLHYQEHTHPYKCDVCDKRFLRKANHDLHKCDPWDGEPVICEVCKKKFRHPKYLQKHMVIHGDPRYTCDKCEKKFHRIDHYNYHMCINDKGERSMVRFNARKEDLFPREKVQCMCPTCGNTYVSMSNLNKHMLTHGDKTEKCDVCGKMFHLKVALREHMKSVHCESYKHQCQFCGKFMKSRNSIFGHIRQFHSETLIMYQCEDCGKSFRQKGNLKKHSLIHSDAKLFNCTLCERSFKYPEQLRRHELWHKEGAKFQCEFCNRRFVMQHELRKHHKLFHSGQVYTCEYCFTECRHSHTMKRHLQRRHMDIEAWKSNTNDYVQGLVRSKSESTSHLDSVEKAGSDKVRVTVSRAQPVSILPDVSSRNVMPTVAGDMDATELVGHLDSILPASGQSHESPLIVAEISGIGSSGESETMQTVIIQTGPGQFEANGQPIPQELANALQELSRQGALEEQSTISIVGEVEQQDDGEQMMHAVPVIMGDGGEESGYIMVPMSGLMHPESTLEVDSQAIIARDNTADVNVVEAALTQAMNSGEVQMMEYDNENTTYVHTVTVPMSADMHALDTPLSEGVTSPGEEVDAVPIPGMAHDGVAGMQTDFVSDDLGEISEAGMVATVIEEDMEQVDMGNNDTHEGGTTFMA